MTNKKLNIFFTFIIVAAFVAGLLLSLNTQAVPPKRNLDPSDYHTGLTWKEAKKLKKPMVVNFYVDWCGACRRFAPVLDKIREQMSSDFSFVIVNSDLPENEKLVKEFNITGFPTLFYVNEKTDERVQIEFHKYFDENKLKKELSKFIEPDKD